MSPGADPPQWLFAYGALVAHAPPGISRRQTGSGVIADLPGFRRTWGVAMDNRLSIPGYKYYVDPVTGARPAAVVAFLDIEPCPGSTVNGICVPVTADRLDVLDRRERQYGRIDLRERFPMLSGPVWAYVGGEPGRLRRREGDRTGITVVARDYIVGVERAFDELGARERRAYDLSTASAGCPVIALSRRRVPGGRAADATRRGRLSAAGCTRRQWCLRPAGPDRQALPSGGLARNGSVCRGPGW